MCEWRSTRFGDICEHSAFGPRFSGKSYDEDGSVATLRTTDIAEDGRIDYSTMPRADLEHARFGHHFLRAGDLVISRSGRIGTTAVFEGYDSPVLPGAFLLRFRLKRDVAEPSFYRYYFNSLLGQTSIRSIATGSVQQNIKISSMHELLVPVPSLQTQRHIAHILGTLDDKIELNRRMNRTLEAIVRAIFKSWFIDFDPVIDNALASGKPIPEELRKRAEIRTAQNQPSPLPSPIGRGWQKAPSDGTYGVSSSLLERGEGEGAVDQSPSTSGRGARGEGAVDYHRLFPDEFQDSPLGKIPKGWEVSPVGHEFRLTMGQSPPGSTYNEDGDGLPFFQGRRDFGFRFPTKRVFCTAPKRIAGAGDTLVSVRAPVGDVNMAPERLCVGRGLAGVRHRSGSRSYTYYSMLSLQDRFREYESEGTVFGAINKSQFAALECVSPFGNAVKAFERRLFAVDETIRLNEVESSQLASVRDTLLPGLLSGELQTVSREGPS